MGRFALFHTNTNNTEPLSGAMHQGVPTGGATAPKIMATKIKIPAPGIIPGRPGLALCTPRPLTQESKHSTQQKILDKLTRISEQLHVLIDFVTSTPRPKRRNSPPLAPGEAVKVEGGPDAGSVGIVRHVPNDFRSKIEVALPNQRAAQVRLRDVRKLEQANPNSYFIEVGDTVSYQDRGTTTEFVVARLSNFGATDLKGNMHVPLKDLTLVSKG